MNSPQSHDEADAVAARYARRGGLSDRYGLLQPDVWQTLQERQRAEWRLWTRLGWAGTLGQRRWTEVGCGAGGRLLECLRAGFRPEHLTGLELLPERHAQAAALLPATVALHLGDALAAPIAPGTQDVVAQATVFSSVLDAPARAALAAAMWRWVRPGGGILWYDLAMNNPRNPDVRGVPLRELRALFPDAARVLAQRITLAPPLARHVCRLHPALYTACNRPWLRTHRLCWIEKKTPTT